MRLVIACEIYPPDTGGPASFVKRIIPVLKNKGFDIKTITYSDKSDNEDDVIRIVRQKNLVLRLNLDKKSWSNNYIEKTKFLMQFTIRLHILSEYYL